MLNLFRVSMTLLGVLMLIGACRVVQAQEPRIATITFHAPTKYTDGTPIEPGTEISYRLYQGEQGEDKQHVATISTTSTTVQTGLQPGKTYCWEVTAVINEQESARSNEGCKTFDHLVPEAVTITVE